MLSSITNAVKIVETNEAISLMLTHIYKAKHSHGFVHALNKKLTRAKKYNLFHRYIVRYILEQ
jgi:hypothetical protein